MSATTIDGKAEAATLTDEIARESAELTARGTQPGIAVVLVGDDPASAVYVANKAKTAKRCGFHSVQHRLPAETSQADLLALVQELNDDAAVHGILVQLPLPKHLDSAAVIATILPEKDVDGLHTVNAGKLAVGDPSAIVPCTPKGCAYLVSQVRGADLSGLSAVVLGRSRLVGLPMALLLTQANATVTIAHSRTADIGALVQQADIVVAAVGRPAFVKADWVKEGASVIDVGINRIDDPAAAKGYRIVGDVEAAAAHRAAYMTPVPGGVGPMTIAMLMANTLAAAKRTL